MTNVYPDPRPMTAAEIARGIASGRHQPVDDLYERRSEQVFLDRGMPAAEAKAQAQFWARLKAADPTNVIGPADDVFAGRSRPASIPVDETTGRKVYSAAFNPSAAASTTGAAGPPTVLETPPIFQSNLAIQVDRFALNPGEVFFRALLPGATFDGAAPSMFVTGDLPPFTGSGVDASVLRWCPWYLRHSGALTSSRAQLLAIIEEFADGSPDYQRLQSVEGQDHLQAYLSRISGWAQSSPATPMGNEEIEQYIADLYGSPQPDE
jgi:hypothetical protein